MSLINISSLQPKQGKLIIKHPVTGETFFQLPDGEKVQLILYIVGRNSPQWLEFMKKINAKGGLEQGELFSRISENAKSFVANQIVGWEDNGALKEPYSPEKAEELINDPHNNWMMEQIQTFLIDETNFFFKI
jgi:hypothetical protein